MSRSAAPEEVLVQEPPCPQGTTLVWLDPDQALEVDFSTSVPVRGKAGQCLLPTFHLLVVTVLLLCKILAPIKEHLVAAHKMPSPQSVPHRLERLLSRAARGLTEVKHMKAFYKPQSTMLLSGAYRKIPG